MERLLAMDKPEYVSRMQTECRRIMEQVADTVNAAPTGNVISGSEMQVRDLMAELRRKAFEMAVQMRVDSTESTFSPPKDASGKPKENKGVASRSTLSVNGRIELSRRRFGNKDQGSECPSDLLVDETDSAVSVGVRQLCCREGTNACSFDRGRENLRRAAQITVGEEQFRLLVESEGKAVLKASADEQLELDWSASQCKTQTPDGKEITRMYASADGVLVPTTTQREKDKRRATVLEKRRKMLRQERRKLNPLKAAKKGSDQRYKQIYVTCFYDQSHEHRLVGVTREKVKGLKSLLKREAARVHLRAADDLLKYVTTRQEMILYEKCDPRGWDVGSGPMESMCGATTDRVKGRGRRWDLDNAEAMMALEGLYQSTGLWDQYWANAFGHLN